MHDVGNDALYVGKDMTMAGTTTHLVIADILLPRLPQAVRDKIHNKALYYCGNMAPDAIMERENYVRTMKLHTHFRDGIGEDDLGVPENFRAYRERFEAFINKHLRYAVPKEFELYLGYVMHIMADEVFVLEVRQRHSDIVHTDNPCPDYSTYFRQFGRDVDLNDFRLRDEYQFSYDILELINSENDYEIENLITKEELMKSREYVIRKNFGTPYNGEQPLFLKYEENQSYIRLACKHILTELPKIFE